MLDIVRERPSETVVLLSNDRRAFWAGRKDPSLHADLQADLEELAAGDDMFSLATALVDIEIPKRFAGPSGEASLNEDEIGALVAALFSPGPVLSHDLWSALPFAVEEPVDAEVSEPGNVVLESAIARPFEGGGTEYRVRLRLSAQVLFDWEDLDADLGSREALDITVRYEHTLDGALEVDFDSVDVQPAPGHADDSSASGSGAGRSNSSLFFDFFDWSQSEMARAMRDNAAGVLSPKIEMTLPWSKGLTAADLPRRPMAHGFNQHRPAVGPTLADHIKRVSRGEIPAPADSPIRVVMRQARNAATAHNGSAAAAADFVRGRTLADARGSSESVRSVRDLQHDENHGEQDGEETTGVPTEATRAESSPEDARQKGIRMREPTFSGLFRAPPLSGGDSEATRPRDTCRALHRERAAQR